MAVLVLILIIAALGSNQKSIVTSAGNVPAGNASAHANIPSGNTAGVEVTGSANESTPTADKDPLIMDSGAGQEPDGRKEAVAGQTDEVAGTHDSSAQLLQSASVDLNGDTINEEVEAIRVAADSMQPGRNSEFEGRLIIRDADEVRQITFCRREDARSSMLSGMQFEDLDGDGSKDVFLITHGHGASFSYSNYFIYSCKKDVSYSFTSDSALVDFIAGFKTEYVKGGNRLSFLNEQYGFSADLLIEDMDGGEMTAETMLEYVRGTWIDPVSVDISDDSRLALIKGTDNMWEIKVPLPIFGMATVNMIGEIDLFYSVDESFEPVLKRFEILDFAGSEKVLAGSCEVK